MLNKSNVLSIVIATPGRPLSIADNVSVRPWCSLVEAETGTLARPSPMPPNRLMTLLEQAVAFQIDSGRYHPKASKQNQK